MLSVNSKYKVCTLCQTYNQSAFIEDALRGFSMQDIISPVVFCVIDDASTDNEPDVLRKWAATHLDCEDKEARHDFFDYGEQIVAPLKDKRNLLFVILLLKTNHYGKKSKIPYIAEWHDNAKYIALCEGDDYWTESHKLQLQVEFLDSHATYSAHATRSNVKTTDGNVIGQIGGEKSRDISNLDEMAIKRQFHTASVMFRREYRSEMSKRKLVWDTGIFCYLATKGIIGYDNRVTNVYRLNVGVVRNTNRMKWLEINERWSNILYEQFGPSRLSYTGAYLSLTRDILSLLINKKIESSNDRNFLWKKYHKYSNIKINLKNIPFVLILLRNRLYVSVKNIIKK